MDKVHEKAVMHIKVEGRYVTVGFKPEHEEAFRFFLTLTPTQAGMLGNRLLDSAVTCLAAQIPDTASIEKSYTPKENNN